MHAVPRGSARHPSGNWIWLVSGVLTATMLTGAVMHYARGRCTAVTGTADTTAAGAAQVHLPGHRGSAVAAAPFTRPRRQAALALFYDPGAATGSCSLGPFPADGLYASLPPQQFRSGAACGTHLEVQGPDGRVRVDVVDLCPGCAPNMINLSRAAFARVADPAPGSARVMYWPAPAALPRGTPATGASARPAATPVRATGAGSVAGC
jgi:expansin